MLKYIFLIIIIVTILLNCNSNGNNITTPENPKKDYTKEELIGRWVCDKSIILTDSKNVNDTLDILLYFEFHQDSLLMEDEMVIWGSGSRMFERLSYGWKKWELSQDKIIIIFKTYVDEGTLKTDSIDYEISINNDTLLANSFHGDFKFVKCK